MALTGSSTDPIAYRMPRGELERRWALSREYLQRHDLDAVIALGFDDSLSGFVRWFCDFGAPAYMKVVIFYSEGPMSTIEHGSMLGARETSPADPNAPGVGRVLTAAAFKSIASTFTHEADAAVTDLQRRGVRRVALLHSGAMPVAFVDTLKKGLPHVSFTDETEVFDRFKAIKSSVELDALRDACRIQDEVFAALLEQVRPGVTEGELLSFAERQFRLHGALDGTMASASAPPGKPAGLRPWRAQNRLLQRGDCLTVLLEMSSAAGYYGELARQVVIGKANEQQLAAFATVRDAQAATIAGFRPGASCRELAEKHDRFMESRGFGSETRLFSHSQGYDMVERPLIRRDETMHLDAGMFLSCHPAAATPSLFVFLCDNFIVHADRCERVHTTPQQIFEV